MFIMFLSCIDFLQFIFCTASYLNYQFLFANAVKNRNIYEDGACVIPSKLPGRFACDYRLLRKLH